MKRKRETRRKGNVVVMVAVLIPVLLGMGAFAIDVGYIAFMRSQAQAGADAGALAATEELPCGPETLQQLAFRYASFNMPSNSNVQVTAEPGSWGTGSVRFYPPNTLSPPSGINAVRITIQRSNAGLFFGQFLGKSHADVFASATAAYDYRVSGFEVTPDTPYPCSLLPFVVEREYWYTHIFGEDRMDLWTYDEDSGEVSGGGDGTPEINLYPNAIDDNPSGAGNFGTVDIGTLNNATPDIDRQIIEGPNATDLSPYGGRLELDEQTGTLSLWGDTGISAALKDPLTQIIGQPRTIMLYSTVDLSGNNACFIIVGFVGITIVDVNMTANPKFCTVQPTVVTDPTAITGDVGDSYYVRYPPQLVQ